MGSSRKIGTNESIHTYGDGTREYTSLQTWEDAHTVDCVATTTSHVLECYDDAASFNDYVTIAGATTNSTYFRIIRPAAGQGHDGTPNNGVSFFSTTDANLFDIQENYCQVQDLIGKITNNSASGRICFTHNSQQNSCFVGCIAFNSLNSGAGNNNGFQTGTTSQNGGFINCLAHNNDGSGLIVGSGPNNYLNYAYNCTSHENADDGVRLYGTAGTARTKNCLAYGNTDDFISLGTGHTNDVTYCASEDTTADDWGGDGNRISQTFTFVNSAGDDFHLATNDAGAKDFGTDLSADGTYPFDDDIDKNIRTGSWDIGFDQHSRLPFLERDVRGVDRGLNYGVI